MNDMKQKDNTMRATPETDDATKTTDWFSGEPMVPSDFARRLERERDEALEELANLRMENNHNWQSVDDLEKVTGLAHELRDALDALGLVVGLTAFKHESQRLALQEALDASRQVITKAKEVLGET